MSKRHVFLSYCHDDRDVVAQLRQGLRDAGEIVWWDQDIGPGQDWKHEIRTTALKDAYAFVLCLSANFAQRTRSGVYPEVLDAIGIYREYAVGNTFLIPVRLSDCAVPPIAIDAVRSLDSIQFIDLWPVERWTIGIQEVLRYIRKTPERPVDPLRECNVRAELLALERSEHDDFRFAGSGNDRVCARAFTLPNTLRANPFFLVSPELERCLGSFKAGDIIVLHGLGGTGKTQHAVQYALDHQDSYGQVLWASANTVTGLYESLAANADSTQAAVYVAPSAPAAMKVRALFEWLADQPSPWLLILDSADSSEVVLEIDHNILPSVHRGHVLITSRVTAWPPAFRGQAVSPWSEAQASAFLLQRLDRETATDDLVSLGTALGGLPLALEQAAAYIQQTRVPIGEYLRLLKTHAMATLARPHPGATDYPASVATTWLVTIQLLSTLSRDILSLTACLSSEPIPRETFLHLKGYRPFDRATLPDAASVASSDAIDRALGELAYGT